MPTINLGYGKVNLAKESASYAVFVVRTSETDAFERVSALTSGRRMAGTFRRCPATEHEHINGAMYSDMIEHAEGTILLLQSSHRRGMAPISDGALFLRLRDGADVITVTGHLPTDTNTFLGDKFLLFSGAADVLTPSDLRGLGVAVPRRYSSNFMDEEQVQECYDIRVVAKGTPKPIFQLVATETGVQVLATAAQPVRRLRIRQG